MRGAMHPFLANIIGAAPVLAAALVCAGPAAAAHGDFDSCCADLDERVAELEQMAARKGNRKVKLTISGWVNEALFMWDDGTDKDAYVGTNFLEQSRFRFLGEAKIDEVWSAGYLFEIGVAGHPSNQWDQEFLLLHELEPSQSRVRAQSAQEQLVHQTPSASVSSPSA